jgi:acetolactate synthase-1/3 small subunit
MGHQRSAQDRSALSAWQLERGDSAETRATYAVIVDNRPGVLHRVVGLFSARGYNIETLTVAETDHEAHTSRITVTTRGTRQVLDQLRAQLEKLVCVREVFDVGGSPAGVERELALVKVRGSGPERVEALRVSEIFRARVIDTTHESFIFEITGAPDKIDSFEQLMRPLGLVEVSRTGVLSITRGPHRH